MPRRRPLWLRAFLWLLILGGSVVLQAIGLALAAMILFQQPWFVESLFTFIGQMGFSSKPQEPAADNPRPYPGPTLDAREVREAGSLFVLTNLWETHLRFTSNQWASLGPRRIPALRGWLGADGRPTLRNPYASRAGVAGVLGFDLPWSTGQADFSGVVFPDVAVRFKGNGTFLDALGSYKRSFKLDLNKGAPGRAFAGQTTLNLHNLAPDRSFLADTLGYEFYRDAGVPAPRTTFTRVFLTLGGRWEHRLLGLYVVVENPDKRWARHALGTDTAVLFKPVSHDLFADLGPLWDPYSEIYDLKTDATPEQRGRLIDFCRWMAAADEAAFAAGIGDWFDLDATARFLACDALTSNYDGILMNGQNFILYLDPRIGRFGFAPWDLDRCWGEFGAVGSRTDREQASLLHPWVGPIRFLERLLATPDFQARYRRELTRLLDQFFIPERLNRRIDELAKVIRPAVAEQSTNRLAEFEVAVGEPREFTEGPHRSVHQLKRFIAARAPEARAQLEGRSAGRILQRQHP